MPLVITRRDGQSVDVDGPATITVSKTGENRVKLTITAEPHVKILRSELRGRPKADDDTDEFDMGGEG